MHGQVCCPSTDRHSTFQIIRNNITASIILSLIKKQCGPGLWFRAAYLNMSDPSQSCPANWREYNTNGTRACGRADAQNSSGCSSAWYHTYRGQYSKICGRVIGYQVLSPDAFALYRDAPNRSPNLNDAYVDGVSVTYGTPRTHVWTFAAGLTEGTTGFPQADCPCSAHGRGIPAPAFIGNYTDEDNPVALIELYVQ